MELYGVRGVRGDGRGERWTRSGEFCSGMNLKGMIEACRCTLVFPKFPFWVIRLPCPCAGKQEGGIWGRARCARFVGRLERVVLGGAARGCYA